MTIKTLKTLIGHEFDRADADSELISSVMRLIELYESELLPDYTRPVVGVPNQCDWSGVPDEVPYGQVCPCNPANGGSGICGCTMGNRMVPNPAKYGQPKTNFTTTGTYSSTSDSNIKATI